MAALLFRLLLLASGLGAAEIGLASVLTEGSPGGWALLLVLGLPLIVAGSAGFIGPLFGGPTPRRPETSIRLQRTGGPDRAPGDRRGASRGPWIIALIAIALAAALLPMRPATATAHEGEAGAETLAVEPTSVTAGQSVVVAGSGLEPETERVLVLAGQDLVVEFGTVAVDAEGSFQKEVTIPSHLPSGTYELRAIGDETLTVTLTVTAAAGNEATPGPSTASETVVPRQRSPLEIGLILALAIAIAVTGAFLVWRAERFRGASPV